MTDRVIAPLTERWNEGERDWSFVVDAADDIATWERDVGIALPDDYRRFMLTFNGGYPYPNVFAHQTPMDEYPLAGGRTFLDPLFDWAMIESEWRDRTIYGDALPPGHLMIGGDPGGLLVLMTLGADDFGAVVTWVARGGPWGSERNTRTWPLAASFTGFIEQLHDDAERSGWRHWHMPLFEQLAKPLVY